MLKIILNIITLLFTTALFSQTFSDTWGGGGAIPDNNDPTLTCFPITIGGIGTIDGTFGVTEVCIDVDHTFDGDLDIFLQAPDGTMVELSTDNGGGGDDFIVTCFDMGAGTAITAGTSPFNGSFSPEGNINSVNNGQNANGDWSICIQDDAGGDTGSMNEWSITFGNNPPGPTPGVDEFVTTIGGGTVNGCVGTVFDPGYTLNYGINSVTTQTFCSDNGGQISIDFGAGPFGIGTGDVLSVYDGTTTATTPIISGTTNPGIVTSTTGCITIELSTGANGGVGFEASISCPTCSDGIENGNETGIDCGGPDCAACPNCFNGIQDGNETGIDCGPSCPEPCHCSNGILDGDETDIDCGGSCVPCPEPCAIDLTWSIDGTGSTTFPGGSSYSMNSSTVNTCGGTFLDPGGNGDYANNELETMTFCSDNPDPTSQIVFDFSAFDSEGVDDLLIYDGPDATFPQVGDVSGHAVAVPFTIQSTSGCLTFVFDSDFSVVYEGWEAEIGCYIPPVLDCNGGNIILTAMGTGASTYVLDNDFDFGDAGTGWNTNITADYTNPCDPSLDGGTYMWMGNSAPHPRTIETIPMDVTCGGQICFLLDFATQGNASPCEGIDEADEGVFLEYSTDGGTTWNTMEYFGPEGVGNNTDGGGTNAQMTAWNQYCLDIPAAAETATTIFQWSQTGSSGLNNDHWGLDNITISSLVDCTPYVYDYTHVGGGDNNAIDNEAITATTDYTVTYTNGTDACSTTITVPVPPGTTADAGPDQVLCFGDPGVTIGADPVSPDEGATYTWDNGAGNGTLDLSGGGQDHGQATVSPAVTTTYELTVDLNGCEAIDLVTVVVDLPPTASNPAPINVQCSADVPAPDVTVVTDEADDITMPPTVTF